MRTISVDLNTHFGLSRTTYAYFLLVEPLNGDPEGYTSHDQSHTIDGVLYDSGSNNAPTRIPTQLKLDENRAETTMLFGAGTFDLIGLKTNYYYGAKFRMFAANYLGDLTDQVDLMAGTLGKADIVDSQSATIELRSLSAPASTPHGRETSPICDIARFGRGRCKNAVADGGDDGGPDIADYTDTVLVTAVVSASRFTIEAPISAVGWSDAKFLGIVRATSGANFNVATGQGTEEVAKSYNTGTHELTLRVPLPFVPEVGDEFEVERGCDKAWATCLLQPNREDSGADDSEGNYRNFGGFPFIPLDAVTKKQG